MKNYFMKTISIMIIACLCLAGSVCVVFADESGDATDISASVAFTHKSYAKNDDKLGEIVQKDNFLTLKWNVANPALYSLYKIYRHNPETGGNKFLYNVKATTKKSYSYSFPARAGYFNYEVRAMLASDSSQPNYASSGVIEGPKVPEGYLITTTVKKNLSWTAEAKSSIPLYKKPGKSKYTTVPKGTSMTATWEFSPKHFEFWDEPSWVQVRYKGKTLWAKWSKVNMHWHITHHDYAWSTKEKFVNSTCKGKSKTNYLIWVSRYAQRTNIFKKSDKKWKLIKVYDCNTGNYYQPLKGGQYYIKSHAYRTDKIHRDGREYYFLYSTKFGGSGSFHTRCRWSDTDNLRNAIKRHPTTKGCDRLYDAAAQYVYNLPTGTGVLIK